MSIETDEARDLVIRSYFETTSAKGSAASGEAFASALKGLERRLGSWLDVKGLSVVDLGSGTGELCALALSAGASRVVGVNMSAGEVEFAKINVAAEFVIDDIEAYLKSQPAASVDRIFALNILEHVTFGKLVEVLGAALRALRPGGQLIAMVPNATSPFGGMTRYWDVTHHTAFTPSGVRQLANLLHFSPQVDFRECGPVPHGFVSGVRYCLWQMIRVAIAGYLMVELASAKGGIYTADMMFRLTRPAESLPCQ